MFKKINTPVVAYRVKSVTGVNMKILNFETGTVKLGTKHPGPIIRVS